jgi:hypothetical protein
MRRDRRRHLRDREIYACDAIRQSHQVWVNRLHTLRAAKCLQQHWPTLYGRCHRYN